LVGIIYLNRNDFQFYYLYYILDYYGNNLLPGAREMAMAISPGNKHFVLFVFHPGLSWANSSADTN